MIGTIAGVTAGGGLALARDRILWTHERLTRWSGVRRETCVEFLHAANEVWRLGHLTPYVFKAATDAGEHEKAIESLEEAREVEARMWRSFHELQLIASEPVVAAAQELARSVRDIAQRTNAMLQSASQETLVKEERAGAEVEAASFAFINAVRAEIDVASTKNVRDRSMAAK